jgi:uncharacterized RDD family membrane protein YckC
LLNGNEPTLAATTSETAARTPGQILVPGQLFGAYRIVRLLGRGGMGEVFEAEDAETGRRVALKVLRHAPDSPTARQRFLREGKLAASVNHPNSVYIYGAEEIEGAPVITMEYVSGGTLQERVRQQGPLPVAEAVDAILQVIAGLEAAGEKGVLHRDVKPSNCFVDADGTVKVGDFGLSISTLARRDQTTLTMTGSILGTPEYASPEQLRGEDLDMRTDIYSVGVTLYYLLLGHTPFQGDNMVGLIATVLDKPPPRLRPVRRDIPKGIEQIVLRCMAKQPQQRFKTYEQLRQSLRPFCSTAPTPATLALRTLAFIIDFATGYYVLFPTMLFPRTFIVSDAVGPALQVLYFAVCEGLWGASLGKWICRLRVVGPNRNPPGFPRALARSLLVLGVLYIPNQWGPPALTYVLLLLLFITARRRNGFAGLHDLLTGARVTELPAREWRPKLMVAGEPAPQANGSLSVGPFQVLDSLGCNSRGEILLGFDIRLLRKVWILKQPPSAAPVPARLRDLSRKGRLHWLAGRRSTTESWDAYEALSGQPLISLVEQPQPWRSVRYWLYDLAEELQAAGAEGSWPDALELNRVWITAEGRALLLDSPAPGARELPGPVSQPHAPETGHPIIATGQQFLSQVARSALSGLGPPTENRADTSQVPLAISARQFLKNLPAYPDLSAALVQLRPLLDQPARVSRARRLGLLSCAPLLALSFLAIGWLEEMKNRSYDREAPGVVRLHASLSYLSYLKQQAPRHNRMATNARPSPETLTKAQAQYEAMQIYVAGRFGSLITNETFWSNKVVQSLIPTEERQLAERALAEHPALTEAAVKKARELVKQSSRSSVGGGVASWLKVAIDILTGIGVYSLLCGLLFRRGTMLRALGLEVVASNGLPAGRWLMFCRGMLTWLPWFVLALLPPSWTVLRLLMFIIIVAGTAYAVLRPERGVQDWLAKTWLVPR